MQVWPKNDEMRKLLKHEPTGIAFYETGSADWPDDSFTFRRIQDGDVTTDPPAEKRDDQHAEKRAMAKPAAKASE